MTMFVCKTCRKTGDGKEIRGCSSLRKEHDWRPCGSTYGSNHFRTMTSEGTIELVVYFDHTTDNDGSFVRCLITAEPNNIDAAVIGDWRRNKEDAFRVAMEKMLKEKKPLNTLH